MRTKSARVAMAVLTGVAVVGGVAGCATGSASMSAHALKQFEADTARNSATPTAPGSSSPTASASATSTAPPTPSAIPTAKSTAAAVPTHPTAAPKPTPAATPVPTPTPAAVYSDGSFSATGNFQSPGGNEKIRVTLTIAHDIIQSVSVSAVHIDSTSTSYETQFEGGIGAVVVGKNIDSINVGVVAGASLNGTGFNQAIGKIKSAAKI